MDAAVLKRAETYTVSALSAPPAARGSRHGRGRAGSGSAVALSAAPAEAAGVALYQSAQALEQLSRTAADRAQNAKQIGAIQGQLADAAFVGGFGSMGGEEFFSYLEHQRQHEARRWRRLVEMAYEYHAEDSRPAEQRWHMGRSSLHHWTGSDDQCGGSQPYGRSCALTAASSC